MVLVPINGTNFPHSNVPWASNPFFTSAFGLYLSVSRLLTKISALQRPLYPSFSSVFKFRGGNTSTPIAVITTGFVSILSTPSMNLWTEWPSWIWTRLWLASWEDTILCHQITQDPWKPTKRIFPHMDRFWEFWGSRLDAKNGQKFPKNQKRPFPEWTKGRIWRQKIHQVTTKRKILCLRITGPAGTLGKFDFFGR